MSDYELMEDEPIRYETKYLRKKKKKPGKKGKENIRLEVPEGEEEEHSVREEEDIEVIFEEDQPTTKAGEVYIEESEAYLWVKKPTAGAERYKHVLKMLDLPVKEEVLKKVKVRDRVMHLSPQPARKIKVRRDAYGGVLPYLGAIKEAKKERKLIGMRASGKIAYRIPKKHKPMYAGSLPTPKKVRNEYDDRFQYGDYVRVNIQGKNIEGVLVKFNKDGAVMNDKDGKSYAVDYNDIHKIPRAQKSPKKLDKIPSVNEILDNPVHPDMRAIALDLLADLFYGKMKAKDETEEQIEKTMKSPEKWVYINEDKKSFEDYWNEQFRSWAYQLYRNDVIAEVEAVKDKIMEEAIDLQHQMMDYDNVMRELIHDIPEFRDNDLTAGRLIYLIEHLKNPSILEVRIAHRLYKFPRNAMHRQLEDALIAEIDNYIETQTPSVERLYDDIYDREFMKHFEAKLIKEAREEFDHEFRNQLTKEWNDYSKAYDKEHKKYDEKYKKASSKSLDKSKGYSDIRKELENTEKVIYEHAVGNTAEYLGMMLVPLVFLNQNTPIGKAAKWANAKVDAGDVNLNKLHHLTIANYFPEFAMNLNLSDSLFMKAVQGIEDTINYYVMFAVYSFLLQSYANRFEAPRLPELRLIPWDKILIDPKKKCEIDSLFTDVEFDGKDVALSDLTICYDPENEIFTCQTYKDILYRVENNLPNPYTNKPYPKTLVENVLRILGVKNWEEKADNYGKQKV
jgi:hypothetical protein